MKCLVLSILVGVPLFATTAATAGPYGSGTLYPEWQHTYNRALAFGAIQIAKSGSNTRDWKAIEAQYYCTGTSVPPASGRAEPGKPADPSPRPLPLPQPAPLPGDPPPTGQIPYPAGPPTSPSPTAFLNARTGRPFCCARASACPCTIRPPVLCSPGRRAPPAAQRLAILLVGLPAAAIRRRILTGRWTTSICKPRRFN